MLLHRRFGCFDCCVVGVFGALTAFSDRLLFVVTVTCDDDEPAAAEEDEPAVAEAAAEEEPAVDDVAAEAPVIPPPPPFVVIEPLADADDEWEACVEVVEVLEGVSLPSVQETVVGGVPGRLSWSIFWMTRALVRTGPDRMGAKVTEPKSFPPGGRSSSLKLAPTAEEVEEVPLRRLFSTQSLIELILGRSSTRTIGCSGSFEGDLPDARVSLVLLLLIFS